ncbi:MAG: DNA-processing protein DprA [bacterium]|nr:DNA-processing protein DprA [bacterium]
MKAVMKSNLLCYLGFSHCLGIGPTRLQNLLSHLPGAEEAYEAPHKQIASIIGPITAAKFVEFRSKFNPEEKMKECEKKGIRVVCWEDEDYPVPLKTISDPPICLYIKGKLELIDFESDFLFAVVGTRKPTSYGQQLATRFSNQLSEAGVIIVSGMAIGIDTLTHRGAIDQGGKTIAVLGCGVDIVYPPTNGRLYEEIISGKGIVISEFPPGMTVQPGLFIARNRIISGLSRGVLVVEGAKHSGALITARYAAEQGKDVFAPPGPITSEMSEAPNLLLKEGAKLVTRVEDILEEYNMTPLLRYKTAPDFAGQAQKLTSEEKKIYELLGREALTIDEIGLTLKQSIQEVSNTLSVMEIKGIVEKNSEGKYMIV